MFSSVIHLDKTGNPILCVLLQIRASVLEVIGYLNYRPPTECICQGFIYYLLFHYVVFLCAIIIKSMHNYNFPDMKTRTYSRSSYDSSDDEILALKKETKYVVQETRQQKVNDNAYSSLCKQDWQQCEFCDKLFINRYVFLYL